MWRRSPSHGRPRPCPDGSPGAAAGAPGSGQDGRAAGLVTQPERVLAGRDTELAPVLPAELGRAVVADAGANAGHVARPGGEQQAGLLQAQLLLELDRG